MLKLKINSKIKKIENSTKSIISQHKINLKEFEKKLIKRLTLFKKDIELIVKIKTYKDNTFRIIKIKPKTYSLIKRVTKKNKYEPENIKESYLTKILKIKNNTLKGIIKSFNQKKIYDKNIKRNN